MFRYIVVIWSESHPAQAQAAQFIALRLHAARWQESWQTSGMRVFQTGVRPGFLETESLGDAAGVVIGTTFERGSDVFDDTPAKRWHPSPAHTRAILESRGSWLIDHCWGNYVAILRAPDGQRVWIIKDPTGNLPCFTTTADGVTIAFSLADDVVRLGLRRLTLNRAYLRSLVVNGFDFTRSPLNEVEQVRRGECIEVDVQSAKLRSRRFLWRPQTFADSDDAFEDADIAARAMRASVRMSTHTWAALESSILLRLSGGLDSSIVAGCLKDAPNRPKVCCYTHFNEGAPSDERPWARLVVAQHRFEHREVAVRAQDISFDRASQLSLHTEPISILVHNQRSTIEPTIAKEAGAATVFNGDGGDSIFGSEATRYVAGEYIRRRGLSVEAFRIAANVGLRTQESSWRVLHRAITGANVDSTVRAMPEISRLISRDALAAAERINLASHPWFGEDRPTSWAVLRRLGALMGPPDYYDGLPPDDAPAMISPLYAQPVTEMLLRIPLYHLFEGGRDRGLARRAFRGDVPELILARQWKDRVPGFHDQLVFINRAFLREVFRDGVLVREGLLERTAIEEAFADRPSKSQVRAMEVIRHFNVEMWARAWESSATQSQQPSFALAAY